MSEQVAKPNGVPVNSQESPYPSTSNYQPEKPQCNVSWTEEFSIPWKHFPTSFMQTLKAGKRPQPSGRREMVRILAAEIYKKYKKPGKKALAVIAQKLVKRFPNSFQDVIEDTLVGTGYDSMLKQWMSRIDNGSVWLEMRKKSGKI